MKRARLFWTTFAHLVSAIPPVRLPILNLRHLAFDRMHLTELPCCGCLLSIETR